MPRAVRNPKLDSRSARAKLPPRSEPYWTALAPGRHLGYRKLGGHGGTWVAKMRDPESGKRWKRSLGPADDALEADGARVLVSLAAWAPGLHGPDGEWERITKSTGLPLFVCNRTGNDKIMSFAKAESVVAHHGRRLLSMTSTQSAAFLIEWAFQADNLHTQPIRLDIPMSAH